MPKSEAHPARLGRPRNEAAISHAAIMDAVYELLQEKSARDLTMEAVARRAKVGKPTLYKWWPSKAALIMAMFQERLARQAEILGTETVEQSIRAKLQHFVRELNGLFGKVMADLIAEGQSDPTILRELYEQHISSRRASTAADIERAKANGEFHPDTNPELLIDAIFSPPYYRLLLRLEPLTEETANELVDQVLNGVRNPGNIANTGA
jgi:AcrR family transcriptional regulator